MPGENLPETETCRYLSLGPLSLQKCGKIHVCGLAPRIWDSIMATPADEDVVCNLSWGQKSHEGRAPLPAQGWRACTQHTAGIRAGALGCLLSE